MNDEIDSPFGGPAQRVQEMSVAVIAAMYQRKCGVDVSASWHGLPSIWLYRCEKTGYQFWRPASVAGAEDFYQALSDAWPNYYRTSRWEHARASRYLQKQASVLEIGCGPGHFLKSLEATVPRALGIEFNTQAIANKVTRFPIITTPLDEFAAAHPEPFDAIYAFQVLEHVTDPCALIESAMRCLNPGGLLLFSTPNHDHAAFHAQEDPFDLPPHHMGHFTAECYLEIGRALGLTTVAVMTQKRRFRPPHASKRTQASKVYRLGTLAIRIIMNAAYAVTGEAGENLLVVYRKP